MLIDDSYYETQRELKDLEEKLNNLKEKIKADPGNPYLHDCQMLIEEGIYKCKDILDPVDPLDPGDLDDDEEEEDGWK